MSIKQRIIELEKAGELVRFDPPDVRPAKRRLFLARESAEQFRDKNSAISLLKLRGWIKAAMVRWVRGDLVYRGFLKPLEKAPPKVFEVRVTEPDVQVRLFCFFAYEDTLIGTKFYTRPLLGDRKKKENKKDQWDDAKAEAYVIWNRLFPGIAPFSASEIRKYVTENCDEFKL
jgi:hypothetical protein